MVDKQTVLTGVRELAASGQVTLEELSAAFNATTNPDHGQVAANLESTESTTPIEHKQNLSASQVLYYMGAIIIYAAIATFLGQAWPSLGLVSRITFTFGLGLAFWGLAWYLLKDEESTQASEGMGDAVLLVGSISVSSGVFLGLLELAGRDSFEAGMFIFGSLIIASLHLGMDLVLKKFITRVVAALAVVAAYIGIVVLIFGDIVSSAEFWGMIAATAGAMIIGLGSVTYKYDNTRLQERTFLWAIGGFGVLGSLYSLTISSEQAVVWQLIFPAVLYGAFLASIRAQSRNFLYSGAFFLLLYVMSVAFQYFSGLGVAGALLVAGFGIIGSGMLVQNIKKKYFNTSTK